MAYSPSRMNIHFGNPHIEHKTIMPIFDYEALLYFETNIDFEVLTIIIVIIPVVCDGERSDKMNYSWIILYDDESPQTQ